MAKGKTKDLKPHVIHVRIEDDVQRWLTKHSGGSGFSEFIRNMIHEAMTGKRTVPAAPATESPKSARSLRQELHLHMDNPVLRVDSSSVLAELADRIEEHTKVLATSKDDVSRLMTLSTLKELVKALRIKPEQR